MMDTLKLFSLKGITVKILPMISLLLFSFGEIFKGTAYIIMAFLLVIPFVVSFLSEYGLNRYLLDFVVLIFFGSIFNLFVTDNGLGGTFLFLTNVALALYCLINMRYVKYIALIVLCYNLIFLYNKLFVEMVNPNYIYEDLGLSRNHPGMLLVIWTCSWGFMKYLTEKNVTIIMPVLSCVIAFFLEGRSSLGILLFLSIVSLCIRNRHYVYIIPLLFSVFICIYWDVIIELYMMTSFAENSLESARYNIWEAYFEALDLISLLGGLELGEVPLIRSYGNNPHNFLLNFHYRMGLLGVFALVSLLVLSIKRYIKRQNYIPLLYLTCLVSRFMFDACVNTTYDFILYAMLLCPVLGRKLGVFQLCVPRNNKKLKLVKQIWGFI